MSRIWEDDGLLDFNELEYQITQFVDKSEIEEMLKIQVSEFEMLESMFSNPGEFEVHDYSIIADINEYIEGKISDLPPQLNFTINLVIDELKLQVAVNLPHIYPADEPDIFVRCDGLTRTQQHTLNCELAKYVCSLNRGEICICPSISWLQENATKFCVQTSQIKSKPKNYRNDSCDLQFTRFWIYSHHIYSKMKRRCIMDLAREYNISGFCLPGRPGIICGEGISGDCDEWWHKIKSMNWKKIMCKKKEEESLEDIKDIESVRKFLSFEEISFETKSKGRDCHMDMGEFYKYLAKHECGYVFKDYFGVDGKTPH